LTKGREVLTQYCTLGRKWAGSESDEKKGRGERWEGPRPSMQKGKGKNTPEWRSPGEKGQGFVGRKREIKQGPDTALTNEKKKKKQVKSDAKRDRYVKKADQRNR